MSTKKETIPNLIMKKYYSNLSFEKLLRMTKDNYSEIEVRDFILGIKYPEVKEELIKQAKEYYAYKFSCNAKEVCYGDFLPFKLGIQNQDKFPYTVVIGDVVVYGEYSNMNKLKYVANSLTTTAVTKFENLETVKNKCDITGSYQKVEASTVHVRRASISLPKLKECAELSLSDAVVESLNVKELKRLHLLSAKIKNLETKSIEKLYLSGAQIDNAEHLDSVKVLEVVHEMEIKYLNPYIRVEEVKDVSSTSPIGTRRIREILNEARERTAKKVCNTNND